MTRALRLAALLALGPLLACGGGSSTEPTPTLAVEALVSNPDLLATILRVDIHFDGVFLGTAGGGTGASSTPPMHFTVPAPAGRHVVRATIADQTVSPSRYLFTAIGTRSGQSIPLGTLTASVETGGTMEIAFTLP